MELITLRYMSSPTPPHRTYTIRMLEKNMVLPSMHRLMFPSTLPPTTPPHFTQLHHYTNLLHFITQLPLTNLLRFTNLLLYTTLLPIMHQLFTNLPHIMLQLSIGRPHM